MFRREQIVESSDGTRCSRRGQNRRHERRSCRYRFRRTSASWSWFRGSSACAASQSLRGQQKERLIRRRRQPDRPISGPYVGLLSGRQKHAGSVLVKRAHYAPALLLRTRERDARERNGQRPRRLVCCRPEGGRWKRPYYTIPAREKASGRKTVFSS